ncbi:MAG: DNA-binding protein WhiA [Actinobacteria bacterium]|nr:DNA-binding protein WhiA [Actinomycetota bacterium]
MNEFENDVKSDITRSMIPKACCRRALLSGMLWGVRSSDRMFFEDNYCSIGFDNAPSLKLLCQVIRGSYRVPLTPGINRKSKKNHFTVHIQRADRFNQALNEIGLIDESLEFYKEVPARIIRSSCCKVSFIKGAFLSAGSIRHPSKGYYAEFRAFNESFLSGLQKLLERFQITSHFFYDRSFPVLYIKESDHMISLLSLLGAHHNLLEVEDIKLIKEIKNEVNRVVNCDAYNTKRVVEAAQRQISVINKVEKSIGLHNLSRSIQEVARLRLDHPMASLSELSRFTKNRVSKSVINHRFKQLKRIIGNK